MLLGLAAVACTAYGASPQFTYADIAAGKFAQRTVAGLRSMADGEHYTVLDSRRVVVFSYASGDREGVLASPEDIGAAWQRIADYRLVPRRTKCCSVSTENRCIAVRPTLLMWCTIRNWVRPLRCTRATACGMRSSLPTGSGWPSYCATTSM